MSVKNVGVTVVSNVFRLIAIYLMITGVLGIFENGITIIDEILYLLIFGIGLVWATGNEIILLLWEIRNNGQVN